MCGFLFVCGKFCLNAVKKSFHLVKHRGPDYTNEIYDIENVYMGFAGLNIFRSENPKQPLISGDVYLLCNGEIYNYRTLYEVYFPHVNPDTDVRSDCEIIIDLSNKIGVSVATKSLVGEFAFVLFNAKTGHIYVARDSFGVRPLFISFNDETLAISSEMKVLNNLGLDSKIIQFPPCHFLVFELNKKSVRQMASCRFFKPYAVIDEKRPMWDMESNIRRLLRAAVRTRLPTDRKDSCKVGCLLSGGLDSSIIYSLLQSMNRNIPCFSVGLKGSEDVKFANMLCREYFLTHGVSLVKEFTPEEGIRAIEEVIYCTETIDVTTIRASIPSYLLCKHIREHYPHIKVLFSGEGSDEIFGGYKYFKKCVSEQHMEEETIRRLDNIHYYDGLRADRTSAKFGFELRVPFLDTNFTNFGIEHVPGKYKMSANVIEKKILRDAFKKYLPENVCYRVKDAFSDAVSSQSSKSWIDILKTHADATIPDDEFKKFGGQYPTKESFLYAKIFQKKFGHNDPLSSANMECGYWQPKWCGGDTFVDPSAKTY